MYFLVMNTNNLNDLNEKILHILSKKEFTTAQEVYSEISGFKSSRFGRSLVILRLKELQERGYISISNINGDEEKALVISLKLKKNSVP